MEPPLDALDDAASLLAAARRRRAEEDRAAADVLAIAAKYAALHSVDSMDASARLDAGRFGDRELSLAGEGAPLMAESAAVEFAAALGLSTTSGKRLLGQAIELRHRLPHVWARVLDGTLPAWKARRTADRTIALAPDAAAWVDTQLGPAAHKVGPTQLDRLITDAIALFEPEVAAALADQATDHRGVEIDTQPLFATPESGAYATAEVHATLDVADALDLEQAVATIAHGLLDHETTHDLPLDARRAAALGVLARTYNTGQMPEAPGTPRAVNLYIHTDTPDLAETGLVRLRNTRGVASIEQLQRWATMPGTTIRPVIVIDLNEQLTRDGYTPSPAQHEQATLIHQTCAFPHCHRPAETCDLDHRVPYNATDSPGTVSANLTPLCRRHHRAKTFFGWTYQRIAPGEYLWRSPHGYTFRTTPTGTEDTGAA